MLHVYFYRTRLYMHKVPSLFPSGVHNYLELIFNGLIRSVYVHVQYSTENTPTSEITPTPAFEWKFLHNYMYTLIYFKNTPMHYRKWCNLVSASVMKRFSLTSYIDPIIVAPICSIRDKDNLLWISVEDSGGDKEQPSDVADSWLVNLATLPMLPLLMHSLYFKRWHAPGKDLVSYAWVGLISRQN